jgi:hypothetical protein
MTTVGREIANIAAAANKPFMMHSIANKPVQLARTVIDNAREHCRFRDVSQSPSKRRVN